MCVDLDAVKEPRSNSHLTSWIQKAQPTSTNVHWMLEPHIFCSQSVSHMCLLGYMVDGNPGQNREQTRKREKESTS